jgi:hydroxylamine reductase
MNKFYYYYNPVCTGANTPTAFGSDPYVAVIKEMFISELQHLVYYIEKLKELDVNMTVYTDKVIEFIGILIVNLDFKKESFFVIFEDLYNNKIMLKKLYISACEKENITPSLLSNEISDATSKDLILKFLNNNEKEYKLKENKDNLTSEKKYLYEIIICLVLTACNYLIRLKSCNADYETGKNKVLQLFNNANNPDLSEQDLKESIEEFCVINYEIIKKLYKSIEIKHGKIISGSVPVIKKEGKAILVSGNNLNDLNNLLDAVKGLNINVYTHNGMIKAFMYENFRNNQNLAGHYQYSENNYSIDFASFPGPIFICGNSTPKIDLIRGQIYTTAKYPAYGIAKIENNDYSEIIEYAIDSKGFEINSKEETISIGYDASTINAIINEITEKKLKNDINRIIIIGMSENIEIADDNIISKFDGNDYILSFVNNENRKNYKYINAVYDYSLLYKIIESLKDNIPDIAKDIIIYINECSKIAISHIFNLRYLGIKEIFIGQCCPNIINPNLIAGLEKIYNIKQFNN